MFKSLTHKFKILTPQQVCVHYLLIFELDVQSAHHLTGHHAPEVDLMDIPDKAPELVLDFVLDGFRRDGCLIALKLRRKSLQHDHAGTLEHVSAQPGHHSYPGNS